ncbi:mastermind-like protein 2 [Rhinophrynus dorsalis]
MGETAPPQAPASGLGIGVAGVGLLGGGSVTPRVHSAIVERLRARIAVCRQHHLNCEGRYERSRAESSDRERENTLQLLTLVQHGQGTRKSTKHSKSTCAPPPDYHRHHQQQQHIRNNVASEINGSQQHQTSNGLDQRNSALIALQGSLKRRLVVNVSPMNSKRSSGVSDNSFLDFKKERNGRLSAEQNFYNDALNQSSTGSLPMGQGINRTNNNITSNTNCSSNDMFNFTLKDIKKEPGETMSCSKHLDVPMSHDTVFKYEDDGGEQLMDPDLQELFNELTYISVPPMTDTELQNMINITIKQDEPINIDIGQQNQRTTSSSLLLDKVVIKSEYSPCLNSARCGSPQMRPSSTGPTFSLSNVPLTSSPNATSPQTQTQPQVSSSTNRLNNWQELSHAQQLKQIAANRQHNLLQQHQPNQSSAWPNMSSAGPSSRPFGDEKIPSSFRQQQFSPHSASTGNGPINGTQPKGMSNYLFKPNSSSQNNPGDMIKQQDSSKNSINTNHSTLEQIHNDTKPLFHFNQGKTSQQVSSVLSPQGKPILQYTQQTQSSAASQQHEQPQQVKTIPNQSLPKASAYQQKLLIPKIQQNQPISGLHYQAVHQQDQHSTVSPGGATSSNPGSCSSPTTVSVYSSQQPSLDQQLMEKSSILQRQMIGQKQQLILQQQMLAGTEKGNGPDQLNHLNRPPPDYKDQRRNSAGMQQASQYSSGLSSVGVNSNPPITNPITTQNQGHSSTNPGSRMPSLQGVQTMYVNGQALYNGNPGVNQMQQQTSPNQVGTNQNSHVLSRQPIAVQGNTLPPFTTGSAVSSTQYRSGSNHGTNMAAQRPPNGMINSNVPQNWIPQEAKKQNGQCFPNNSQFSNQSLQGGLGNLHFSLTAPNQITPGTQMRPVNQLNQATSGQAMESLKGFNNGQTQLRAQLLHNHNHNQAGGSAAMSANTFSSTNQSSRSFPGTDASNDLGSFDFLSQNNGGLGPALNSDSDFIDALLKTGHINDDWMKDINLDEIFKGHS